MPSNKITVVSSSGIDTTLIEQQLQGIDYDMEVHVCKSDGETIEAIKGADLIISTGVAMPRSVIDEIDQAQAIVNFGHGFDRIDADAATDKSVMVVNTAGFCTEEVSNHAIMLLLACAKKLTILNDVVKTGMWDGSTKSTISSLGTINGQVLGLVGLGNIARATSRKAKVFGLEVIAYDPYVQPWIAREYSVRLVHDLKELAQNSDYVSVHVPLNQETRKLLGRSFFKAMKETAFIVNTCRGGTIDESALVEALQNKELAGAGLDVFEVEPTPSDNPLLSMGNVIVTPHSAGTSAASRVAAPIQVGQESARILEGSSPMALANPEVMSHLPIREPSTNF